MSQEINPEWIRVKREIEALWRGAWSEIHHLSDLIHGLEERIVKIERDIESNGRAKFHWNKIDKL